MSYLIQHIKNQIFKKNRNFVCIIVGKVGTGKSYSAMRLGEELDDKFNIDKVFFNVEDLLKTIHENTLYPGEVLILDEAGVAISNRQHYMNKFNKSMSFLLQTWRHRNLILFVTVPDISFVDAGIRKLFDAILECRKVVRSEGMVKASLKFIQVNPQSGKAYFHNIKGHDGTYLMNIKKPDIKIVHRYEKRKTEFTSNLYQILEEATGTKPTKSTNIDNIRRCPQCGNAGRFLRTQDKWKCYTCGNKWTNLSLHPANI